MNAVQTHYFTNVLQCVDVRVSHKKFCADKHKAARATHII